MSKIGFILKRLREIYGKSAQEFARIIDLSPSYLSEIEHCKKQPSLVILQRYADVFGIKLSTIVLIAENPEQLKQEKFYKRVVQPIMRKVVLGG